MTTSTDDPGKVFGPARGPIWVAVGALALGFLAAWVGAPPFSHDAADVCDGVRLTEGSSYRIDSVAFPPGASECTYTLRSGETGRTTYVPWLEWLVVVMGATGLSLASSAVVRGVDRRLLRAYVGLSLVVAAGAMWFDDLVTGLVVLGALGAVAVAGLVLGRSRPPSLPHRTRAD